MLRLFMDRLLRVGDKESKRRENKTSTRQDLNLRPLDHELCAYHFATNAALHENVALGPKR